MKIEITCPSAERALVGLASAFDLSQRLDSIERKLDRVLIRQAELYKGERRIMAIQDEIVARIQSETAVIDGMRGLVDVLVQRANNAGLTDAQKAAIFGGLDTNDAALQTVTDALVAGTPAEPQP